MTVAVYWWSWLRWSPTYGERLSTSNGRRSPPVSFYPWMDLPNRYAVATKVDRGMTMVVGELLSVWVGYACKCHRFWPFSRCPDRYLATTSDCDLLLSCVRSQRVNCEVLPAVLWGRYLEWSLVFHTWDSHHGRWFQLSFGSRAWGFRRLRDVEMLASSWWRLVTALCHEWFLGVCHLQWPGTCPNTALPVSCQLGQVRVSERHLLEGGWERLLGECFGSVCGLSGIRMQPVSTPSAASVETTFAEHPLFLLRSGLWSVTMVNLRPHKYWWNFFSPSMTANPSLSICA